MTQSADDLAARLAANATLEQGASTGSGTPMADAAIQRKTIHGPLVYVRLDDARKMERHYLAALRALEAKQGEDARDAARWRAVRRWFTTCDSHNSIGNSKGWWEGGLTEQDYDEMADNHLDDAIQQSGEEKT